MNINDSSVGVTASNASQDCMAEPDVSAEIFLKITAFSLVLFMACIGNLLVIWVVHKNQSMRKKPINLFIVNLAVSDLLLALFVIPRIASEIIVGPGVWLITGIAGDVFCKVVIFVQDVSTAVSLQSLVIIAFDRFCAVVYPFRIATMSCTTRLVVIPMTWFVACAIHSPYFHVYQLSSFNNKTSCVQIWSSDREEHERIARKYYIAMFCIFVAIPVILLTVLYSAIFYHLKRRGSKTDLHTSALQTGRRKEQEWNVLKMAMAIVLGFAVCYGPFNVLVFLRIFKWDIWIPVCSFKTIYFVTIFLVYFNTALNPIIYFTFSENFRLGFIRVFTHRSQNSSTAKCFLTSAKKIRTDGVNCDSTMHAKTTCHILDTAL
ncbi:hypothetical protein QZH41_004477 [Actinostola sp. cb2023]|nr:hypothetical protein QZH41_004477 [Actinostola sp. cb2023]